MFVLRRRGNDRRKRGHPKGWTPNGSQMGSVVGAGSRRFLEAADLDVLFTEAEGVTEFVEVGGLDFGGEVELTGLAVMVDRADEDDDEIGGRGAVEAEDVASVFRPVFQDPGSGGCSGF